MIKTIKLTQMPFFPPLHIVYNIDIDSISLSTIKYQPSDDRNLIYEINLQNCSA